MGIDETEDRAEYFSGIKMEHIEEEYIFSEKKTVGFPANLGISGYCYKKSAISYINKFSHKQ